MKLWSTISFYSDSTQLHHYSFTNTSADPHTHSYHVWVNDTEKKQRATEKNKRRKREVGYFNLVEIEMICNIRNVFTLTFTAFNASYFLNDSVIDKELVKKGVWRPTWAPDLWVETTSRMRRSSDGVTPPTRKRNKSGWSLGCGRVTCREKETSKGEKQGT